jgi:hypothetical protein
MDPHIVEIRRYKQSKYINLSIIVSLYESLELYVQEYRKLFENILQKFKDPCGKSTFS